MLNGGSEIHQKQVPISPLVPSHPHLMHVPIPSYALFPLPLMSILPLILCQLSLSPPPSTLPILLLVPLPSHPSHILSPLPLVPPRPLFPYRLSPLLVPLTIPHLTPLILSLPLSSRLPNHLSPPLFHVRQTRAAICDILPGACPPDYIARSLSTRL